MGWCNNEIKTFNKFSLDKIKWGIHDMLSIENILYLTLIVFFIVNKIYKKYRAQLEESLHLEDLSNDEIWEIVKEESKKGNKQAIIVYVTNILINLCFIIVAILCWVANM